MEKKKSSNICFYLITSVKYELAIIWIWIFFRKYMFWHISLAWNHLEVIVLNEELKFMLFPFTQNLQPLLSYIFLVPIALSIIFLGGRIVLLNSMLNAVPIFYLSYLKMPPKVIKLVVRLQRNFLLRGTVEGGRFVGWSGKGVVTQEIREI